TLPTDQSSLAASVPAIDDPAAAAAKPATVADPQTPAETGDLAAEPSQPTTVSWAETLESSMDAAADPKQQLSREQCRCYDALEKEFPEHKVPDCIGYKTLEHKLGFKRDVLRRTLRVFDPSFVDSRKRD